MDTPMETSSNGTKKLVSFISIPLPKDASDTSETVRIRIDLDTIEDMAINYAIDFIQSEKEKKE